MVELLINNYLPTPKMKELEDREVKMHNLSLDEVFNVIEQMFSSCRKRCVVSKLDNYVIEDIKRFINHNSYGVCFYSQGFSRSYARKLPSRFSTKTATIEIAHVWHKATCYINAVLILRGGDYTPYGAPMLKREAAKVDPLLAKMLVMKISDTIYAEVKEYLTSLENRFPGIVEVIFNSRGCSIDNICQKFYHHPAFAFNNALVYRDLGNVVIANNLLSVGTRMPGEDRRFTLGCPTGIYSLKYNRSRPPKDLTRLFRYNGIHCTPGMIKRWDPGLGLQLLMALEPIMVKPDFYQDKG